MNAVEAFNQQEAYYGPEAAVIMEWKQMGSEFAKSSCVHCFRESNSEKCNEYISSRMNQMKFWGSYIPDFISHLIVNDLSII